MEPHKKLGIRGEMFACQWLKHHRGFKIITQNYHAREGEIDIVAFDKKEKLYVLVEVKTRGNHAFGDGIEAITPQKIKKIEKTAVSFFLRKMKMESLPEYEIHAIVLEPRKKKTLWQAIFNNDFEVEYYDNLGF